ncbi:MAG: type 1 glutamine amidotransferase [Acidimicrobiales bacterium]
MAILRLCHLYPDEMNIYADRGNIAVLRRRLEWRGHHLEIDNVAHGQNIRPDAHDLYYLGGGQDRDQGIVALDLAESKADSLREAASAGAAFLWVCGGIQLAGAGYTDASGERLPGVGILDLDTRAGDSRLIGDVIIEAKLEGSSRRVVGYENHAGRTELGSDAEPFGRVIHGHGNNGEDGFEGAVQGRVIGTYLHGPLLPKNPWVADVLLGWALQHAGIDQQLEPLDDSLADEARRVAASRAGLNR